MKNGPIFIHPSARTGGTLLNTMLDAHPLIAMSYEIYEELLLDDKGIPYSIESVTSLIKQAEHENDDIWIRNVTERNLKVFIARARRGNIYVSEFLAQIKIFAGKGGHFDDLHGRLDFIDQLMQYRMVKKDKQFWGGKARVNPYLLYERHPLAKIFSMVRDGRDVLASRLNVGKFKTDVFQYSKEWRQEILTFRQFRKQSNAHALEIHYETLVRKPVGIINMICEFIGVPFSEDMITFHEREPDLFKHPHGHLSYTQLTAGLNSNSVGRWKTDLSVEQVRIFEEHNSDLLLDYGYTLSKLSK